MAQMTDSRDAPRPAYPPQDYPGYGAPPPQHSPPRHESAREDSRHSYPPPEPARQGQYPPAPAAYPPPQQWAGHPYPYQYPPPQQHDPHHHPQHHYPPPGAQPPPQPMQPDAYRLPPPYPPHYYPPAAYQPPAPAPRQRTAIACKYCRKRKIRCSGYDSSPDGRCQNCVRFNQQCLFHPVSSQAAFVPASAVYGPNARAPIAGQGDGPGQNGQAAQPMLYGAHGQPLGPAGPGGQPQYAYPPAPPPQGYPSQGYAYPPPGQYPPPPQSGYPPPHQHEGPPQAPPSRGGDQSDRASLKRGPPDDDPHNESNGASHSPHPNAKPRHSVSYDGRAPSNGSFEYQGQGPTSPATSTMSYQSYPQPANYTNGVHNKGNNSPPAGLTPQSAHSLNSPHTAHYDGKTPPPNAPGSAGSSQNGRSGMKVHEMLGNPQPQGPMPDQRVKSDNDMLNKLDGKKQ